MAPALRDKGRSWLIPPQIYPQLQQGGVILSWATDPTAARKVRDFIVSKQGLAILGRYGFDAPR
jgi:hypothetical protein